MKRNHSPQGLVGHSNQEGFKLITKRGGGKRVMLRALIQCKVEKLRTKLAKGHEGKKILNCLYTTARRPKQKELESLIYEHKFYLVAISEIRWDVSYDQNIKTNGYNLVRKDLVGKRVGGVAFCQKWHCDSELLITWKKMNLNCLWLNILTDKAQDGVLMTATDYQITLVNRMTVSLHAYL